MGDGLQKLVELHGLAEIGGEAETPGFARYETPIDRLYLCGSAAHPAGYSGRSGWNLARSLLAGRLAT